MKEKEFSELEEKLGYSFKKKDLLQQALTHPSMGYEVKRRVEDNQRMEFLGDAVLQLALTIHLYHKFPEMDEGQLTKLRAQMVNRTMLTKVARALGVGEYLILGRGEAANQGRSRPSNLADAMEAVIGAIYQDGGFEVAGLWVISLMNPFLEDLLNAPIVSNPKGELQELLQSQGKPAPRYETVSAEGPDHNKTYVVIVKSDNVEIGRGQGNSKRTAEAQAAENALTQMKS